MGQDEDLEYELRMSQSISGMMDRLAELMNQAAKEQGLDYEVPVQDIADAKFMVKQLVPYKSPVVGFMVAQGLMALLEAARDVQLLADAKDNPDVIAQMAADLEQSDSAQDVLARLKSRQDALSAQYKDVKVNKGRLRVADLGDLTGGSSFN